MKKQLCPWYSSNFPQFHWRNPAEGFIAMQAFTCISNIFKKTMLHSRTSRKWRLKSEMSDDGGNSFIAYIDSLFLSTSVFPIFRQKFGHLTAGEIALLIKMNKEVNVKIFRCRIKCFSKPTLTLTSYEMNKLHEYCWKKYYVYIFHKYYDVWMLFLTWILTCSPV